MAIELPKPIAVTPTPNVRHREFTKCGQKPLSGGQIWTYEANSTIPKVTYQDPFGLAPNTNPIILDAAGEADIFLNGTYRFVVKDRRGVVQKDVARIGSWFSGDLEDQLKSLNDALESSAQQLMQPLADAIDVALAAGAGESGWVASLVADESGKNQQQINNDRIRTVESVADMLAIKNPKNGNVVYAKGYKTPNNFALAQPFNGGGYFVKRVGGVDNGGTYIDGWQRLYSGAIDFAWFGATWGEDASPYIERAFKVSNTVTGSGRYKLSTVVGLPDQNNYAETMIQFKNDGELIFDIDCDTAVFTSLKAKANPNSTENLFTAKINVSGIGFNSLKAGTAVFNGDRLYNLFVQGCNFKGNLTIVKAYILREAGRQYTQSVSLIANHLANVHRIIESDKSYNLEFTHNMCEACTGGFYLGVDRPWDPSVIQITVMRNLWEGGGLFFKSNGGVVAGSFSRNYFETNLGGDVATEKCLIKIARKGAGAGYSGGLLFDNNLFSGVSHVADYVDVRLDGQLDTSQLSTKNATTKSAVFLSNWSDSKQLTNDPSALLIGNKCTNRAGMRNAYGTQEAMLSFFSGRGERALTVSNNSVLIAKIDLTKCGGVNAFAANFRASFDAHIFFKTAGGVNTATVAVGIDLLALSAFGADNGKVTLKAKLRYMLQSDTSDKIGDGTLATMGQVLADDSTLELRKISDEVYEVYLTKFTQYSAPNWGAIARTTTEYSMCGSLAAAHTSNFSSFNFIDIS